MHQKKWRTGDRTFARRTEYRTASGVDAAGRPLQLIITAEQVADISYAQELSEHLRAETVIADKGNDVYAFAQTIRATRAKVVITPRSNRKTKHRYSRALYRTCILVERFLNRIKHFRRVSTRYDKLADELPRVRIVCLCV